jgi:hypothetical protein
MVVMESKAIREIMGHQEIPEKTDLKDPQGLKDPRESQEKMPRPPLE